MERIAFFQDLFQRSNITYSPEFFAVIDAYLDLGKYKWASLTVHKASIADIFKVHIMSAKIMSLCVLLVLFCFDLSEGYYKCKGLLVDFLSFGNYVYFCALLIPNFRVG